MSGLETNDVLESIARQCVDDVLHLFVARGFRDREHAEMIVSDRHSIGGERKKRIAAKPAFVKSYFTDKQAQEQTPKGLVRRGRHTTSSDLTAEETERVREAQNLVKRLRKEAFERKKRQLEAIEAEAISLELEMNSSEKQKAVEQRKIMKEKMERLEQRRRDREQKAKDRQRQYENLRRRELDFARSKATEPLYKRMEKDYEENVLLPELEERKKKLMEIQQRIKPVDYSDIKNHCEEYDLYKQEQMSETLKHAPSYDIPLTDTSPRFESKFLTDIKHEERMRKEELAQQKQARLLAKQRREQYSDIVREVFPPTIDENKVREMEQRKLKFHHAAIKASASASASVSQSSSNILSRQEYSPKRPALPSPSSSSATSFSSRHKPSLGILEESEADALEKSLLQKQQEREYKLALERERANEEQRQRTMRYLLKKKEHENFEHELGISNATPSTEKVKILEQHTRELDTRLATKEEQLRGQECVSTASEHLKDVASVDFKMNLDEEKQLTDIYCQAIKTKIALLDVASTI